MCSALNKNLFKTLDVCIDIAQLLYMQWNRSIKEVDGPTIASCEVLVVHFQRIPEEYAEFFHIHPQACTAALFFFPPGATVRVEGA